MSIIRRAPILLLIVWTCLAFAVPAIAHSVVERSVPPANTVLERPPKQVDLWFNEAIDEVFSSAQVLGPSGSRMSRRATIAPDGRRMIIPLGDLSKGVYTVRWRVLSTVDGHTTSGAFVFSIGVPGGPTATAGAPEAPDPWLVIIRWIGFLAAVLLAGSIWFPLAVLRPGLQRMDPPDAFRLDAFAGIRFRRLAIISSLALLVSAGLEVVLRAMTLIDASLSQVISSGQLWIFLWGTKPGWSAFVRSWMALLLLLPRSPRGRILQAAGLIWFLIIGGVAAGLGGPAILAGSTHIVLVVLVAAVYGLISFLLTVILPHIPDFRLPEMQWVSPIAAFGALAAQTLTSHAWGSGPLAVVVDMVHLAAVALWIGGLACLLLLVAGSPADRLSVSRALVPRFSTVAGICLGIVVVTGLYSSWIHIPGLVALIRTNYGRALLLKLVIILPLVALGAINRFVLRPRLTAAIASRPGVLQRLLYTLTGEVGLGVLVLLVVAVLTLTPPASVTMPAAPPKPLIFAGVAQDVQVRLSITPALPGWNRLELMATGQAGQPIGADARLLLRLIKLDEDLAITTMALTAAGPGRAVAEGGELSVSGWWEVEVIVRRRGRLDVSTSFPLRLGSADLRPSDPVAVRLLKDAAQTIAQVRSWRQSEQITDGVAGMVFVTYEMVRPDRVRARASDGTETVVIGDTQYQRSGSGPWERSTLKRPFTADFPYLTAIAEQGVTLGRQTACDDETCQVVLWETPGRPAAFAGWIGKETKHLHKLLMVAPAHFMTLHLTDLNGGLRVAPPK
ncbi:MAG: copper resistance CopC/CopD family protein [Armatimonadota bacterium]